MKLNRPSLCIIIAMGMLALEGMFPASIGAANSPVGRESGFTPSFKLHPREARIIASTGTRALVHVAEARGAIRRKDASRARDDVRKVENLVNIIRSTTPTANVKNRIWIARRHLEYEETQQVLPDLVPIDEELIRLEDFVPTGEAKSHLEKARACLESGNKQAGRDELKALGSSVVYEEVDLPISETEAHLNRALSELAIGETEKADSALRAAEDSLQSIVAAATGPLTKDSRAADAREHEGMEGK